MNVWIITVMILFAVSVGAQKKEDWVVSLIALAILIWGIIVCF